MVKIPEGVARYITFSFAAGAVQHHSSVTIQVVDAYGKAVAESFIFWLWVSEAATGIDLSSKPDTAISALSDGTDGHDLITSTVTSQNIILVQTLADGSYVLDLHETTAGDKILLYVAATIPGGPNAGRITVSRVTAVADFKA